MCAVFSDNLRPDSGPVIIFHAEISKSDLQIASLEASHRKIRFPSFVAAAGVCTAPASAITSVCTTGCLR